MFSFFGGAMLAIGWLVLTLGGLCTLIFGAMALGGDREFHVALEDWMVPGSMLAFGVGCIWVGRAMRRSARGAMTEGADE